MATEVALLVLREDLGKDFDFATSEPYQDTIRTLKQQKGFQRVYWGQEEQNLGKLLFFVDWDSVEDHIAFTRTRFGEVIDLDQGQLYHIHAAPHPPVVLSNRISPVTEIWTISFPVHYAEDLKIQFEDNMKDFIVTMVKQPIFVGSATGWVLEDIKIPGNSEKVKSFHAFFGWVSLEAVQKFRQKSTFKEAIAPIENARELVNIGIMYYTGKLEEGIL